MRTVLEKLGKVLRGFFTRNMGMKIGALVFAFLMWSFVQAEENPLREKIFYNVPVTYNAADVLKQRGLTSAKPYSDVLKSVTITVETAANRLNLVTEDTVTADVDLSGITEPGEYVLPVTGTSSNGSSSVAPDKVTLTIESIVSQEIPVEVQVVGTPKDGLYYGDPVLEKKTVEIMGARSNVDKVTRAICRIDISNLTEPVKENRNVILLDNDGNELQAAELTSTPSVIVEVPVYPKKSVPIDTEGLKESIKGLGEGYEIKSVSVSPENVFVVGDQDVIDGVEILELEPITLTDGTKESQKIQANIVLPEGAYVTSPAKAEVTVKVSPILVEKEYKAVDIAIKNLDENFEAKLYPGSIDITVKGTQKEMDSFSADLLKPFVELKSLAEGTYSLEVKFENQPDLNVELIPSVKNIAVTISRKPVAG